MDQLQTDACDKLPEIAFSGIAALCWAGEVGGEWQATVASGHQSLGRHHACFHHEKVAAQEALVFT